jgi:hypothetical protein
MEIVELKAEKIMDIWVECPDEARLVVGQNDFGLLRAICITGGEFHGEKLNGTVVPGGADWNKGFGGDTPETFTAVDLCAKYLLKTDDGAYIAIENSAKRDKKVPESPYIVTTPKFWAPRGKYDWLNYGAYVGALQGGYRDGVRGVNIAIYRML